MLPAIENNRTNQKLIQYRLALNENQISEKNLEWIFQKLGDINVRTAPTNYLKLHCPHLIGNTALHLTYIYDNYIHLDAVLSQGADFTIKNQENLIILHLFLRCKGTNEFRFSKLRNVLRRTYINTILSAYVETRNPMNPCDDNGMSHFHIACMANHVEAVELFLNNNVSINCAINSDSPYFAGFTPIHLAIRCCCLEVTRILLKRGASIYLKNAERLSVFHIVMENYLKFADDRLLGSFDNSDLPKKCANEEIVKLLLEIVSHDNMMIIDGWGLSRLHVASTMMGSSVAEELLVKGDINHSVNIKSPLWPGCTALHFAAQVNIETFEMLMKKGADISAKDANGVTPLDLCVERYEPQDIHDILSLSSVYKEITITRDFNLLNLIFAMSDCKQFAALLNSYSVSESIPSVPTDAPLWPGFTPLHLVVLLSRNLGNCYQTHDKTVSDVYSQMVRELHKKNTNAIMEDTQSCKYFHMMTELHGRNPNAITAQDFHGRTPLHLSFRLGKMKNVGDLLLKLHSNFSSPRDLVDDEDLSFLHIACARDDKDLVEKLLLQSRNIGLTYKGKAIGDSIESGWTPLHVAVANRSNNVVDVLLKHGADVNSQDANGVTPIHLLVLRENRSAAVLLSAPNLRERVVKNGGLSHLHAACFAGNTSAVRKLLDCGSDIDLAITHDPKVDEKSFKLSQLIYHPGVSTPLGVTRIYDARNEKTIGLLIKHEADMFISDSKRMPFAVEYLKYLFADLKKNANLQRQAESAIGLTMVHAACFSGELDWLKHLLAGGANVNGQLSMNCREYAGFTPLHITNSIGYDTETTNEFVKLLLKSGADVTVSAGNQETSLHIAYDKYITGLLFSSYDTHLNLERVIMMSKAQKDFSINPTNVKGISHFHVACNLSETAIVKNFLERGNLDVNQSTDFFPLFEKYCLAGFTPLHMAAISGNRSCIAIASQLETVDLLLRHGADPNFQNSRGSTALHVAYRYEIFERIARDSADVNLVNINGHTPLGFLLTQKFYPTFRVEVSADKIANWLKCGCDYNAFNYYTEQGYIGQSINVIPFEALQNLIKVTATSMPHTMRVDGMGRTVIHNVVSTQLNYEGSDLETEAISIVQYASLIELLTSTGCDIDSQDNLGRTALHLATKFRNVKAISALLMIGADVNVLDQNGKTALAYHIELCNLHTRFDDRGNEVIPKKCAVFEALRQGTTRSIVGE